MSCINEYRKLLNDYTYNNYEHYNKYVLPKLLVDYPTLLKKIQNEETAQLPRNFCRILIEKYMININKC